MFTQFLLPDRIQNSLKVMGFTVPTPIQEKAIPVAMEGKDILGSAQTGTGKTAAFAIPLITKILRTPKESGLILTPTRELATQIIDSIHKLAGGPHAIPTALLIGGEAYPKQFKQLNRAPRIIVATPGRLGDHLERCHFLLKNTTYFVLDEMDRMLDMGFTKQIQFIVKYLPTERQTLMFSATLPPHILSAAQKYLKKDPVRISVGSTSSPAVNIQQDMMAVSEGGKYDRLVEQLKKREGSVLVFVKTKRRADRIGKRLSDQNLSAQSIHGNLSQSRRDRVMRSFRNKEHRIMVATDVAARGLDVPHIEHVINYDLPQVAEDYIHRIGRTARAGKTGSALSFVTPMEQYNWRMIQRLIAEKKTVSVA